MLGRIRAKFNKMCVSYKMLVDLISFSFYKVPYLLRFGSLDEPLLAGHSVDVPGGGRCVPHDSLGYAIVPPGRQSSFRELFQSGHPPAPPRQLQGRFRMIVHLRNSTVLGRFRHDSRNARKQPTHEQAI